MTQSFLSSRPSRKIKEERLFSGIWLRWGALTTTEKIVCGNIVLIPVWWYLGLFIYLPLLLLLAIVFYEWRRYGKLRLGRPSWLVIAIFAFEAYQFIDLLCLDLGVYWSLDLPSDFAIGTNNLIKGTFGFCFPVWIWYIQSHKLKVRLEVIAWAFSVSIVQMFLTWLAAQVFPGIVSNPPRTVYAVLTGKSGFEEGDVNGWTNYLVIYYEGRYRFFFGHNQICAAFLGFAGLLALDLKNRWWTLWLLATSMLLLSFTATRSTWLAFPAVVLIYFMLVFAKMGKTWLMLSFLAIASFSILSFYPVSNLIFNASSDVAESVANARAGSTEIRSLVYRETLERIPDKLFFGHKMQGPPAVEGNATQYVGDSNIRIGSHSYILGDLLYQKGVFGMGLFLAAWGACLGWFYRTRARRPLAWFPIQMFLFLQCFVVSLNPIGVNTLLLLTIFCSTQKPVRGLSHGHG